jgi:hypothetical protein
MLICYPIYFDHTILDVFNYIYFTSSSNVSYYFLHFMFAKLQGLSNISEWYMIIKSESEF